MYIQTVNETDPTIINELPIFPQIPELDVPPSRDEVARAIKQLKNCKAAGPDGVPAEIYKYGGQVMVTILHDLYLTCWSSCKTPSKFRKANIIKIYKRKGDRAICRNSRGLSLLDVAGKILAKVLLARLLTHVTDNVIPESQCGFRADRSTLDMVFVCRQLLEKMPRATATLQCSLCRSDKSFRYCQPRPHVSDTRPIWMSSHIRGDHTTTP